MDGTADPGRLFSDAELAKRLAPSETFGKGVKGGRVHLGEFNTEPGLRGLDWDECELDEDAEPFSGYMRELVSYRGASAQQTATKWTKPEDKREPGEGPEMEVTQSLVSMPAKDARRYLELQRNIYSYCAEVTYDTDAGIAVDHNEVERLEGVGDGALLESTAVTGDDGIESEYDSPKHYTVEVRVGGVILSVGSHPDKDKVIAWAALLARGVGKDLYGTA
ncbi:hypothetical protein OG453_12975 [Streptomyces sp. NBC_01381]|uniref:hypothetical protein n=1 Tax=Streptomyces sp. NBC_01381 TaxID=2903845 RepID=UPI0022587543|nr:hypothetical protein [Streptomyces sp. NBC_01381]MCX4667564.1 hypothetical protein [Streptomyces sp. NBC_01381]